MNSNTPHLLAYVRRSLVRKLWQPLLFFLLAALLLFPTNLIYLLFPPVIPADAPFAECFERTTYGTMTVEDLYYSGYDYYANGQLRGHFYYTLSDDQMQIYLLQASMGRNAVSYYESYSFTGMCEESDSLISSVVLELAANLNWNAESLAAITSPHLIHQVSCHRIQTVVPIAIALFCLVFGLILLVLDLFFLCVPALSPGFIRLYHSGSPDELLPEVEQQLRENCLLRTSDMALTSDYLVEFSGSTSAIVPMKHVLWAFYYGTLRFHRMKYTLYLVTEFGDHYQFRNKKKEELDTILDVLTAQFPNFFIGYSEEHRKLVAHLLKEHRKDKLSKIFSSK